MDNVLRRFAGFHDGGTARVGLFLFSAEGADATAVGECVCGKESSRSRGSQRLGEPRADSPAGRQLDHDLYQAAVKPALGVADGLEQPELCQVVGLDQGTELAYALTKSPADGSIAMIASWSLWSTSTR